MRITKIAVFMLAFSLSLSFFANTGWFQTSYSVPQPSVPEPKSISPPNQDPGLFGIGLVIYSLKLIMDILLGATLLVYPTLIRIGVPDILAVPIATMVYLSYALGLISFMSGRNVE